MAETELTAEYLNTALATRVAELERALDRIVDYAPGWGEESEYIARIARKALASDGSAYGDFMKAAKRLREQMADEHIERVGEIRKLVHGSGGTWFFSHARLIDFVDALGESGDKTKWTCSCKYDENGNRTHWESECPLHGA